MEWDYEFDVVVVGSGNGALTAALCSHDGGAKTLVIEKSSQFGGTSATSGGGVWIPNNRYAKAEMLTIQIRKPEITLIAFRQKA